MTVPLVMPVGQNRKQKEKMEKTVPRAETYKIRCPKSWENGSISMSRRSCICHI